MIWQHFHCCPKKRALSRSFPSSAILELNRLAQVNPSHVGLSPCHSATEPPQVPGEYKDVWYRNWSCLVSRCATWWWDQIWLTRVVGECEFTVREACCCSLPPQKKASLLGFEIRPNETSYRQRGSISLSFLKTIESSSPWVMEGRDYLDVFWKATLSVFSLVQFPGLNRHSGRNSISGS